MNNLIEIRIRLKTEEIGRLLSHEPVETAADAVRLLQEELSPSDREQLIVICLDSAGQPICFNRAVIGSTSMAMINPANIFKAAILANASSVMILHNHPSGKLIPSEGDDGLTADAADAGRILGIPLTDSIITGPGTDRYYSYAQERPGFLNGTDPKALLRVLR